MISHTEIVLKVEQKRSLMKYYIIDLSYLSYLSLMKGNMFILSDFFLSFFPRLKISTDVENQTGYGYSLSVTNVSLNTSFLTLKSNNDSFFAKSIFHKVNFSQGLNSVRCLKPDQICL